MTDRLIGKNEMHNFTEVTTQNGMHGRVSTKTSNAVICGRKRAHSSDAGIREC
jgi:hypothetical protein